MWFLFGEFSVELSGEQKIKGVEEITKKTFSLYFIAMNLEKKILSHMCGMWNWNEILLDLFSGYKMLSSFFR